MATNKPFRYPFRVGEIWGTLWQKVLDTADAQFEASVAQAGEELGLDANLEVPSQALSNEMGGEVDRVLTMEEDRDRALEDYLSGLQLSGGLRFATKVVAASNSVDTTSTHYDYLCTGSGDDVTINAALRAAAGGRVLLMEGAYTISGQITVPANTTLEGQGTGSQIFAANGANLFYSIKLNGDHAWCRRLQYNGNRSNQTNATTSPMYGIVAAGSYDNLIEDCYVVNVLDSGILLFDNTRGARVVHNVVENCARSDAQLSNGYSKGAISLLANISVAPSFCVVANNYVYNSQSIGIEVETDVGSQNTQNILIADNVVNVVGGSSGTNQPGIFMWKSLRSSCVNNTVKAVGNGDGIRIWESTNGLIEGNNIDTVQTSGIQLQGGSGNSVRNNVITAANQGNGGLSGIDYSNDTNGSCIGNTTRNGGSFNNAHGMNLNLNSAIIVINNDCLSQGINNPGGNSLNLDGSANNWNRL